jgi:DNA-binding LacI/PurR family transcriptional regulator
MARKPIARRRTKPPASRIAAAAGMVTSYDVARRAGVSQSAVSRCYKPGASVSAQMRRRVMNAARALNYTPNAIARSLITRRSNLIAVLVSNLTNLYYPEVLSELSAQASARGVRILLFALPHESDVDQMLEQVFQYQVDGVIAAVRLQPEHLEAFERRRTPVVFFNRHLTSRSVNSVCCDQIEGARLLVSRLFQAGHRTYGVIAGPKDSVVGQERLRGSLEGLAELGIRDAVVVTGNYDYESGVAGFRELVNRMRRPPAAVICANDVMAIGCMDAARYEFSLSVPQQLSVVGFDGVGPSRWSSYQLTTVRQPVTNMAEATVALLMDRIENPQLPPEKRLLAGQLVEGQSARLG